MNFGTPPGFKGVVFFEIAAKHVAIHCALIGRIDPAVDRSRIDMSRQSERCIAGFAETDAVRINEILIRSKDRAVRRRCSPESVQENLGSRHRRIGARLHLRP